MAKEGYLRDGLILLSDSGAFRLEQREEPLIRLASRMERIRNEICVLPQHPCLTGPKAPVSLRQLWGADHTDHLEELCLNLGKTIAFIRGEPWVY
jgi:hypothetical protein